ncbi:MAG: DegT/DnrJ/EryC1/StrS aminotransferase family protein [Acidobacteriaceae bacterium]|nr:DegT/DnrJ/EryC1/StrS aminotransferase family protein [Acidobacteriaceae bacterium]
MPFSPPLIGEEEIAEVVDTLRSDWITTGPKVKRFEQEFATFTGASAALAVNSCTAALHLALVALGVGPGDAVITTPLTFCSGVHVIEQTGARPILVDVEPDTLNIDPRKVRVALERAARHGKNPVKAIMPVHLYGHPCDSDALLQLAQEFGIAVIEDAAHGLWAKYKGRTVGALPASATVPVFTAFSFYATKNLTTAEGGMLTGPPDLIEEARVWSVHGMGRDAWRRYECEGAWFYEVVRPGFKYNLSDVHAALGLQQLRKLPEFQRRRREIAETYTNAFSGLEELETPAQRPGIEHAWHIYPLRLHADRFSIDRNQFIEELNARNIGASVHFIPIHLHRYYREKYGFKPDDFPIAYREYRRLVSLPIYPRMSGDDVEDVIRAVLAIAAEHCASAVPLVAC